MTSHAASEIGGGVGSSGNGTGEDDGNDQLGRLEHTLFDAKKNTTKMLLSMKRFESRLLKIDGRMRPLQMTTQNYSKAKENINDTLLEV